MLMQAKTPETQHRQFNAAAICVCVSGGRERSVRHSACDTRLDGPASPVPAFEVLVFGFLQ